LLFLHYIFLHFFSSSAAVEMAVAIALAKLYNWHDYDLSRAHTKEDQFQVRMRLALLCQKVENEFVGVPCGILDQACSAFGEQGRIVRLLCGYSPVAVSLCAVGNGGHTLKMNMWVFASGARHELVDSPYKTRSDECKAAVAALGVESLSDCSLSHLDANRHLLTEAQYLRAKHVIEETHRVHHCVKVIIVFCTSLSSTLTALISRGSSCGKAT
jgi:galactokinase